MKQGLTELVFILDKSGSMSGLESDTIGGFNSMLTKQKSNAGEATVTTVLFDNNYELLHDRIDIKAVAPITDKEYQVGGSTALIDAIGITMNKIKNAQLHTADDYRPEHTMFVIITDGEENSSREYTSAKVKEGIECQKEKHGWEFIFLGANIDAVETAKNIGISAGQAVNYHADVAGAAMSFAAVSEAATTLRANGRVGNTWRAAADMDFEKRKKNRK